MLTLCSRLRADELECNANIPVAVVVHAADAGLVAKLKELDVRRLLLQPFRLRALVHTVEQLWSGSVALPVGRCFHQVWLKACMESSMFVGNGRLVARSLPAPAAAASNCARPHDHDSEVRFHCHHAG